MAQKNAALDTLVSGTRDIYSSDFACNEMFESNRGIYGGRFLKRNNFGAE
jgi:hypothetical protein